MPDAEFVRPFSNGEEYRSWTARNCDRCALNGYALGDAARECDMEVSLSMGTIIGTIHRSVAAAIGATVIDDDGYVDLPMQCAEFKNRDERGDDNSPPPAPIDPAQLTFLPPDGWPESPSPRVVLRRRLRKVAV